MFIIINLYFQMFEKWSAAVVTKYLSLIFTNNKCKLTMTLVSLKDSFDFHMWDVMKFCKYENSYIADILR